MGDRLADLLAGTEAAFNRETATFEELSRMQLDLAAVQRSEGPREELLARTAAKMDEQLPRLVKLVDWYQVDAANLDAALTMVLDVIDPHSIDDGPRRFLSALSRLGQGAEVMQAEARSMIDALDNAAVREPILTRPAGRRAAHRERMLSVDDDTIAMGRRAQSILDSEAAK